MAASSDVVGVATALGPARLWWSPAATPKAPLLVLGHGAGGGVDAPDLVALADALPARGISVVRVEQPWKVAGRRVAPAPARLDQAWVDAVAPLTEPGRPLLVGGRSTGARVACRTARQLGAAGVVALAFPLHPPGRAGVSRAAELSAGCPVTVVQGERDPFGAPDAFPAELDVTAVAGADHSFAVLRAHPGGREEALRAVVEAVASFVGAVGGRARWTGEEQRTTPR